MLAIPEYDVQNRVTGVIQGRNAEPGRVDVAIGYDPVSRVSSIAMDLPTAASPGDLTIGLSAYNPAGQITTRTRSNATYVFDDPVTGSSDYSHATAPVSPNGLNQYRQITGVEPATIGYDGRGNLTFYNAPTNPEDRVYGYDALNRMTSATVGGATTTFSYDPLGRLYEVEDASGQGHRYLWDGGRIIARYDDSATPEVRHRWVHAPGSFGAPLVHYPGQTVGDASRRFLQTDERGSVIAMVDGDNGAQAATNSYDPYGRPGDNNNGDFQYAGQLWIEEARLYYMRNRMYDPVLGRFTQADPIGYAGGMNLYAYVLNDPTNLADPLGLAVEDSANPPEIHVVADRLAEMARAQAIANAQAAVRAIQTRANFGRYAGNEMVIPETIGEEIVVRAPSAQERQALNTRYAVITAIRQICGGCEFDLRNFRILNPNFVLIIDPDLLPRIFDESFSSHADAAYSSDIPGTGYVVKLYIGDSHNSNLNTATITTPLTDPMHIINFPFYLMGDPIGAYNARQYCFRSGRC